MRKRHENCYWFSWPRLPLEREKAISKKHGFCNHIKIDKEAIHSKGKPCKYWERQRFAEESKGIEL